MKFKNVCLVHKSMYGLAPPPLTDFINLKPLENRVTRGAARVDNFTQENFFWSDCLFLQSITSVEFYTTIN